ncbi:MAG: FtsX-like permease family protein [Pirellula sp.]
MRTPLAWLNTTSSLSKLALASSGIGFAVVLMFMQIGFLNGLFDSTVQILRLINADLIIISPARYTIPSEQRFDHGLLMRARVLAGVRDAQPLYIDRAMAEIRVIGNVSRSIRAIGVPTDCEIFTEPKWNTKCKQLREAKDALVDRKSKAKYGFEKRNLEVLRQQEIELSGQAIRMQDWVEIGTDFVYDGSIVLSDRGVEHYFPMRNGRKPPLAAVDLGLVLLDENVDRDSKRRELQELLGDSVLVFERESLIQREIRFWATNTPIGIIFSIGTIMGQLVGVIICYQILFTDIHDHLAEFATLKAMGYSPIYFLRFVMLQSFYLSIFGFLPGWIMSWGLYHWLAEITGLVMVLTPMRVLLVFGLTFLMCMLSGALAVRKLWAADPATLFK